MQQQTLSDIEYSNRKQQTRKEEFLTAMEDMIPWEQWISLIREQYPSGRRGRKPKSIDTMLRMYLLKKWFGLSDAGIEDAVYDSYAMRNFMHIDFFAEQVPDESTLRRFRHLLEKRGIDKQIDTEIRKRLAEAGLVMRCGMIVDAALVSASKRR